MAVFALKARVWGVVQGVGFRAYARSLANSLSLSGYAKNLPDGSVEIFVQGKRGTIDAFISHIKNAPPPILVQKISTQEVKPDETVKGFKIL
ncbi:hypothetical protein B9Q10_01310 [Candidatus Marsarchaeota G2 archaeon ECH_B_SAG-E12]|uniref:Acylphosphatase n=1 Tax=Candidatus Marsarchaeota G2 archaeon ECH_B_SAG-E12 TaxID=1978164 RepID=A0A2R6BV21_9ARCH|nr:MAG: hypothetical protein B9Q10_01310 [Candidatus Marsarchaeota G2 archaeon ECH_B_SAG-E12]